MIDTRLLRNQLILFNRIFEYFAFSSYLFFIYKSLPFINKIIPSICFFIEDSFKNTSYSKISTNLRWHEEHIIPTNHSFVIKSSVFTNKFKIVKNNLINLFFFLNYSYFGSQFIFKPDFNLFYLKNYKNSIVIFDLNKFFLRWNDTYNLLFNLFYFNINSLVLGSSIFKNETLSLNWQYSNFDINLWRYYFPFFIFKSNKYSSKTSFFLDRLEKFDINVYLITDCHYHYKNLFYLKKKRLYSIGLIDIYTNPWILDYPILSFFESILNQAFFFKLLLFIDRQVLLIKYNFFKNYWYNFLFLNKKLYLNIE